MGGTDTAARGSTKKNNFGNRNCRIIMFIFGTGVSVAVTTKFNEINNHSSRYLDPNNRGGFLFWPKEVPVFAEGFLLTNVIITGLKIIDGRDPIVTPVVLLYLAHCHCMTSACSPVVYLFPTDLHDWLGVQENKNLRMTTGTNCNFLFFRT